MQITEAQQEMRRAHVYGAPGVFVSGSVWLVAGGLWLRSDVATGFSALFVGGMLIFPLSLLISRFVFRAPKALPNNPLERLALETTFVLFAGILLAYCYLRVAPELTFPAMALCIGVRYLMFRTIYGNAIYWALGGTIAVVGCYAAVRGIAPPLNLALVIGVIEIVFSAIIAFVGKKGSGGELPTSA